MPNYRNERGKVGTYKDRPVVIITSTNLTNLKENVIYCIANSDPFKPNTLEIMNCYAVAAGQSGKIYCIGTMSNYGKIFIKQDPETFDAFTLPKHKNNTFNGDDITFGEMPPITTAVNFADYTKVVDDYFSLLEDKNVL